MDQLNHLLSLPHETEWLEWKEAKSAFRINDLGKYFSALSNEAFLKEHEHGWLLLGVRNDGSVCGTSYREDSSHLQQLKQEVATQTSVRLTFEEIHEVDHPHGRVVMFQIPAASPGTPTDWKGHYYGRNGDSLVALSLSKIKRILSSSSELTDIERFESNLMDFDKWGYDGKGTAVYQKDADFVIRIKDAGPHYGAGNYWWGRLSPEQPIAQFYELTCKGQVLKEVLVLLFRNECLEVPFPDSETVAFRDSPRRDRRTEYYGDIFYYRRDSIEYKLLSYIRAEEAKAGGRPINAPSSPIQSQVKPPIIKLPFPILENANEAGSLVSVIDERLDEFNSLHESQIADITREDEKKRMEVERHFSEWVHDVWENEKQR